MQWKQYVLTAALIAAPVMAQPEQSAVDVYGGYSLLRQDVIGGHQNAHGWNADVTAHLWKRLSVTAQFGGNYGPKTYSFDKAAGEITTYLFGPHIRLVDWGRLRVSGRLLAGVARQQRTLLYLFDDPPTPRSSTWNRNEFAAALGGVADIKITGWLSWRAAQFDVIRTRITGAARWEYRYSTGAVIHFGK